MVIRLQGMCRSNVRHFCHHSVLLSVRWQNYHHISLVRYSIITQFFVKIEKK